MTHQKTSFWGLTAAAQAEKAKPFAYMTRKDCLFSQAKIKLLFPAYCTGFSP